MIVEHDPGRPIEMRELKEVVARGLRSLDVRGKRVLAVVPDATRTVPLPALFDAFCDALLPRAAGLRLLVALGTHAPMEPDALAAHLGRAQMPPGVSVVQHQWDNPRALVSCGVLDGAFLHELSDGLVRDPVAVRVNREVLEADLTLLVGPVFPHELIGFSGGNKYLFPGVSGEEMVDYTHWLGSVLTNVAINGRRDTPPRRMIEAAADLVPGERLALKLVVHDDEVRGVFLGQVREAWQAAVALSERVNIVRVARPFHTVLAVIPERYEDLWTGSKCMTKLEPVVADGGTLILYGPHISSPSVSHAGWHERIGYHVRDYILAHLQELQDVPLAVLGDLMQLPGLGSYRDGVERRRIDVRLATAIPAGTCRAINIGYADPREVRFQDYQDREEEGVLFVAHAGETLYLPAAGPGALQAP